MSKKIVTFGEIMLRLTTPDNLRIQQSHDFWLIMEEVKLT